jgi:Tol biopolymer transport system component
MTAYDDLDRTLAAWFESDALAPAPAGRLDMLVAATRRIRPRPAWLAGPGSQWVGSSPAAGLGLGTISSGRAGLRLSTMILLLLAFVALVGGTLLVGARLLAPPPMTLVGAGLAYALDGDIYVADADGGNRVRIADGAPDGAAGCGGYWSDGPMWSPDGRHIAYRGGGFDCDSTVYIADPDGRVVASFRGEGWLVSWSPDSTRVATWVTWGKTIAIDGIDGVRQAVLDLPAGMGPTGDYDPVWSPDGRSLLIRLGPPSPSRIWEIPVDGRTPRQVPDEDSRSEYGASWSRDAARVTFVPYLESYSLVIANADGSPIRVLDGVKATTRDFGPGEGPQYGLPVLSPAGDRVAFNVTSGPTYLSSGAEAPRGFELGVVDVSTGTVTMLLRVEGFEHLDPIEFSADGSRLLFQRTDDSSSSIWSVNVDGSNIRLVVADIGDADWR